MSGADCVSDLKSRAFRMASSSVATRGLGVEVEFIPVWSDGGGRVPIESEAGGSLRLLRSVASRLALHEARTYTGSVAFRGEAGNCLSFEPGGQIEYASAYRHNAGEVLAELRELASTLNRSAQDYGIRLIERGIDPSPGDQMPDLHLASPRYQRMAAHFDEGGIAGRRMMRQTAALHFNLDFGADPIADWWLANRVAPFVIALFANSSRYQGVESGFRSFRAQQWRELDPLRTGSFPEWDLAPWETYHRFAMAAPAILIDPPESASPSSFEDRTAGRPIRRSEWDAHLSTLFPEVRPRGYLEFRGVDALPSALYAAPTVFLMGLFSSAATVSAAREILLASPSWTLADAGRLGMTNSGIAKAAKELFEVALSGAKTLEPSSIPGSVREEGEDFYESFVKSALDPASLRPVESAESLLELPA